MYVLNNSFGVGSVPWIANEKRACVQQTITVYRLARNGFVVTVASSGYTNLSQDRRPLWYIAPDLSGESG
jgi:hypothetical protein